MNNQTRADNNTTRTNHFLPTNSDSKVPHVSQHNYCQLYMVISIIHEAVGQVIQEFFTL